MTIAMYDKYHATNRRKRGNHESCIFVEWNPNYTPKHAKKLYRVYRVLGPAGPEESFDVYGIDKVREVILGCWDWDVTDEHGYPVDPRIVLYS